MRKKLIEFIISISNSIKNNSSYGLTPTLAFIGAVLIAVSIATVFVNQNQRFIPKAEAAGNVKNHNVCHSDGVCESNICVRNFCESGEPGGKCEQNGDCHNNACVKGECRAKTNGSMCEKNEDCNSGVCLDERNGSQFCTDKQIGQWCDGNSDCAIADSCVDGTCTSKMTGDVCHNDRNCLNTRCVQDRCREGDPTDLCEKPSDCKDNQCTANGTCEGTPPAAAAPPATVAPAPITPSNTCENYSNPYYPTNSSTKLYACKISCIGDFKDIPLDVLNPDKYECAIGGFKCCMRKPLTNDGGGVVNNCGTKNCDLSKEVCVGYGEGDTSVGSCVPINGATGSMYCKDLTNNIVNKACATGVCEPSGPNYGTCRPSPVCDATHSDCTTALGPGFYCIKQNSGAGVCINTAGTGDSCKSLATGTKVDAVCNLSNKCNTTSLKCDPPPATETPVAGATALTHPESGDDSGYCADDVRTDGTKKPIKSPTCSLNSAIFKRGTGNNEADKFCLQKSGAQAYFYKCDPPGGNAGGNAPSPAHVINRTLKCEDKTTGRVSINLQYTPSPNATSHKFRMKVDSADPNMDSQPLYEYVANANNFTDPTFNGLHKIFYDLYACDNTGNNCTPSDKGYYSIDANDFKVACAAATPVPGNGSPASTPPPTGAAANGQACDQNKGVGACISSNDHCDRHWDCGSNVQTGCCMPGKYCPGQGCVGYGQVCNACPIQTAAPTATTAPATNTPVPATGAVCKACDTHEDCNATNNVEVTDATGNKIRKFCGGVASRCVTSCNATRCSGACRNL